jgi:hypothetical protein
LVDSPLRRRLDQCHVTSRWITKVKTAATAIQKMSSIMNDAPSKAHAQMADAIVSRPFPDWPLVGKASV